MKNALITGGTSGIGLSIAKALLKKDYEVYLIGRNKEKGEGTENVFNKEYPEKAHFIQLDLSNINDVNNFSKKFIEQHDKLDILANVAGVMEPTRKITKEGLEKTFSVGYLSAFILSTQLVPLLEKASHGRIINVAGAASLIFKSKLGFEDLTFSKKYGGFNTAITTVHAKTVLTEILSEKYSSLGVDVNSFHPGAVRSDLMKEMKWITRILFKVLGAFMATESKTGIYVSSAPELNGVTGKYFNKKKAFPLNFDQAYKDQLWNATEQIVEKVLI